MNVLLTPRFPEVVLCIVACVLFLLGVFNQTWVRKLSAEIALISLLVLFIAQCYRTARPTLDINSPAHNTALAVVDTKNEVIDPGGAVHTQPFSEYVKLIATGIGCLLVLLNMPTNRDGSGGNASNFGGDTAEFFGLLLLSLAGLCVVASANDLILLFLGIELASIPTYVMISISRPLPVAQEASLKYFFLGAMSAAIMLFGFSYLYGTTGSTSLDTITNSFASSWTEWQILAVLLLICGFAFKMAAFPLHVYAGDVYQGAATPVTAFLSFVPKTAGFVALIKVLYAVGGGNWTIPPIVTTVMLVIAALTMTLGNMLGLLQSNIKRTLAYSSVAHSGYMLVGVTALMKACQLGKGPTAADIQSHALQGVLFYLAAYGITNVAAFGVLQLLPSRHHKPATSAETFEDIAGQGRSHVALGLAMTVACLSLIGIPLTVGFIGKIYLTLPAGHADLIVLSVILWVNAAISAAYYLRIVATMFLRSVPTHDLRFAADALLGTHLTPPGMPRLPQPASVVFAVMLSVVLTLLLGTFMPATNLLADRVEAASKMERVIGPTVAATPTDKVAWASRP